jgi:putative ABC transport system permease protein
VLAGLLTATVANAGADRRRREQALLRTRGATTRQLVRIALSETVFVGVLGSIAGLGLAAAVGAAAFHRASFGATTGSAIGWAAGSALAGFAIAAASIAWPAGRDARAITVASARRSVGRATAPRWIRLGLDGWFLGVGLLVFWLTGRGGYQLVLAPEGVPSISVSYWAFAGPALLWIGAGLFTWRISDLFLRRGRKALTIAVHPVSGSLASTVAATMSRQRRLLARGVALLALTGAFAASTAVFNSTYKQQANVDALLTNGADVTVTLPPAAAVNANYETRLAAVPGVRHVEAMQHRYAYVGADLQDLFGINPATIAKATKLQDAFFSGGTVKQLMTKLAQRPDNLLVSAETVKDFQLVPGDTIRLRLRNDRTNQLVTIPFHYAGVAKEFPTAPKDSFLIANRDYITAKTGTGAVGAFLLDTGGASPASVAARARTIVGTTATVTDITATRQLVGSSLTAVDLAGLTRVELGFALALAAAASGLALWLGFTERRRTFAIAAALGAKRRQLGGFVWSEAGFVAVGGALLGAIGGWALSEMLVKVLTGVFDPPPAHLAVPWTYLGSAAAVTVVAVVAAAVAAIRIAARPAIETLRDL